MLVNSLRETVSESTGSGESVPTLYLARAKKAGLKTPEHGWVMSPSSMEVVDSISLFSPTGKNAEAQEYRAHTRKVEDFIRETIAKIKNRTSSTSTPEAVKEVLEDPYQTA